MKKPSTKLIKTLRNSVMTLEDLVCDLPDSRGEYLVDNLEGIAREAWAIDAVVKIILKGQTKKGKKK